MRIDDDRAETLMGMMKIPRNLRKYGTDVKDAEKSSNRVLIVEILKMPSHVKYEKYTHFYRWLRNKKKRGGGRGNGKVSNSFKILR